ncbi:MAG: DUF3604 domain-containing protein [Armatimonadota bacterium]|jgi:hypothetical protein
MWSSLCERILAVEAPGGAFERLSIVAPSVVRPDEPFAIRLAAVDAKAYPSLECSAAARPLDGPAPKLPEVQFEAGHPAVGAIEGARISQEGWHRLAFELEGRSFVSNPIHCSRDARRIYWGDPHVHTVISRCHPTQCRSLDFCFVGARYMTGLDWVCAADHVSNGRCDKGKWEAQRRAVRIFDDPGRFAAVLGYEASLRGGCGGDNNVYCRGDLEDFVDHYEDGDARTLAEALPDECFLVPHHTTRTGKHGELPDEVYPGPERMPVVEVHSKWGTSEFRGNPRALLEVHDGPCYAQDLLAQGYPLGFIAGTDTHATMPSSYGDDSHQLHAPPGLTAIRAEGLSREAIFDAIRARDCYAASDERIIIEERIAGGRMGRVVDWSGATGAVEVAAEIATRTPIERVDVVRNGVDVHTVEAAAEAWRATVEFADDADLASVAFDPGGWFDRPFVYYYLRVTCRSGAQAWTSPTWLTL